MPFSRDVLACIMYTRQSRFYRARILIGLYRHSYRPICAMKIKRSNNIIGYTYIWKNNLPRMLRLFLLMMTRYINRIPLNV